MPGPFTCEGCGDTWADDPRRSIACPTCHAPAGSPCKRPSEHTAGRPHSNRVRLAFELSPCACLDQWEANERAAGRKPPPRMTPAEAHARYGGHAPPPPARPTEAQLALL